MPHQHFCGPKMHNTTYDTSTMASLNNQRGDETIEGEQWRVWNPGATTQRLGSAARATTRPGPRGAGLGRAEPAGGRRVEAIPIPILSGAVVQAMCLRPLSPGLATPFTCAARYMPWIWSLLPPRSSLEPQP
jgi:hypothetical protein